LKKSWVTGRGDRARVGAVFWGKWSGGTRRAPAIGPSQVSTLACNNPLWSGLWGSTWGGSTGGARRRGKRARTRPSSARSKKKKKKKKTGGAAGQPVAGPNPPQPRHPFLSSANHPTHCTCQAGRARGPCAAISLLSFCLCHLQRADAKSVRPLHLLLGLTPLNHAFTHTHTHTHRIRFQGVRHLQVAALDGDPHGGGGGNRDGTAGSVGVGGGSGHGRGRAAGRAGQAGWRHGGRA